MQDEQKEIEDAISSLRSAKKLTRYSHTMRALKTSVLARICGQLEQINVVESGNRGPVQMDYVDAIVKWVSSIMRHEQVTR